MAKNPSTEFLTISQLRAQRLKRARGQAPASRYWQGHRHISTYSVADAVPMRPYRPPSAKQLETLERARERVRTRLCLRCGNQHKHVNGLTVCEACFVKETYEEVRVVAKAWIEKAPLFLDTETTGLDEDAQVIEVAVVDVAGDVVFYSLVKPTHPVSPEAREVHCIEDSELELAPAWPMVAPMLAQALAGRLVVAHNAGFDSRLIAQSCRGHQIPSFDLVQWACTQALLLNLTGGLLPSLPHALQIVGAGQMAPGSRHRAKADADACRRIVVAAAARKPLAPRSTAA